MVHSTSCSNKYIFRVINVNIDDKICIVDS